MGLLLNLGHFTPKLNDVIFCCSLWGTISTSSLLYPDIVSWGGRTMRISPLGLHGPFLVHYKLEKALYKYCIISQITGAFCMSLQGF
ncbi:hypothetical protein GDO81_008671 [Engystomops pustulosus]|uniref:Uncharacterized protein n=1 Tax=Engystomops pustulosus TaxID=76066 RepID=A0AAV7CI50_ENGPU|nr:hypothetical protein GDO81_008671 [Engystomops pustulosus]